MTDPEPQISTASESGPAGTPGRVRIVRLGLLGLPGAGKSTIAALLAQRGCTILDADAIVTEAYGAPAVQAAIRTELGADLIDDTGLPQRQAIAALVFADPAALDRLEAILHPWVRRRMAERIEEMRTQLAAGELTGVPVAVLDVPLLAEGGLEADCDAFVLVTAELDTRVARRAAERGWDRAEMERREAAQWSEEKKRAVVRDRPLWTVSNESDLGATERALDACWQEMHLLWSED